MADAKAEGLKAEGNKHFQRGKFKQAISKYTEALNVSRHHVYYSNRAAAYLKLGKASKALKDSNSCVELAPTWVKVCVHVDANAFTRLYLCVVCAQGYLRKGAALQALHRYEEEIAAYQSGLEYDKQNSDILAALEQVMARRRKDEEQKKKVKSNKSMQKPTPALNASDFSDPKKVALIIEQIGVHGTDLKVSIAHMNGRNQPALPRTNAHTHTKPHRAVMFTQSSQILCLGVMTTFHPEPSHRNNSLLFAFVRKMPQIHSATGTRAFCPVTGRTRSTCASYGTLAEMSKSCAELNSWTLLRSSACPVTGMVFKLLSKS